MPFTDAEAGREGGGAAVAGRIYYWRTVRLWHSVMGCGSSVK
jgi:hypothetical protein